MKSSRNLGLESLSPEISNILRVHQRRQLLHLHILLSRYSSANYSDLGNLENKVHIQLKSKSLIVTDNEREIVHNLTISKFKSKQMSLCCYYKIHVYTHTYAYVYEYKNAFAYVRLWTYNPHQGTARAYPHSFPSVPLGVIFKFP